MRQREDFSMRFIVSKYMNRTSSKHVCYQSAYMSQHRSVNALHALWGERWWRQSTGVWSRATQTLITYLHELQYSNINQIKSKIQIRSGYIYSADYLNPNKATVEENIKGHIKYLNFNFLINGHYRLVFSLKPQMFGKNIHRYH